MISDIRKKWGQVEPDPIFPLAGDAYDMSVHMEKILKAGGHDVPQSKGVLELNMDHPLLAKIKGIFGANKEDKVSRTKRCFLPIWRSSPRAGSSMPQPDSTG